ncbi:MULTISPECIES: hypothetical protein [unclassified Brevundimonas]|uniref:hypothetical protein n=1 Tax=unclassified Brevundimonas TaxID=2622653 RepID=UPI003F8DEFEC
MREMRSIEYPTLEGLLADPATSFALKAVIEAWAGRDCVDAAHDARLLHAATALNADRRLARAP